MKITACILLIAFSDVFIIQGFTKHAEVASKLYNRRLRRSAEFEKKLHQFRLLLREPVDEEHDELERESDDTHAHEWTVQLSSDNYDVAREIATKYDFDHVSKIEGVGPGVFRFTHDPGRKLQPGKKSEEAVVEAQRELHEATDNGEEVVSKQRHIESVKGLAADKRVKWYKRERILSREKRAPVSNSEKDSEVDGDVFNDPKFRREWYIHNVGQTSGPAAFDSNIEPVWKMGYTGKNVTLSVLDDGMDHTHPELEDNYYPPASKDLNGHDDDPFPNDTDPYNAHGTKCSGTIAAKANNSICGVGIAFNANIGAIRMLDGKATDGLEADALSYHRNIIDIYSCSWGPKDNGQTFGRPGKKGRIALAQGTKFGRNGLGSLFIWATGNGGMMTDDCNADGYVNSIHTLGIGSVNEHGVSTYYGERCPAMLAVTYCSGAHKSGFTGVDAHANVITTYLHHQCTNHFVGTSSAAPLAAAIFALVLEANPKLTWRDVQHLVFHTAKKTSPLEPGWRKNGAGKFFNHKFGFGVLDALKLVQKALSWETVAKQRSCHFILNFKNGDIPSRHHFKLNFTTDGCQKCKKKMEDGKCKNAITKLEHVVVTITLKHRRRGDLSIDLISPSGTVSHLLHVRPYDSSTAGLKGWNFMTVFNWNENPAGKWQLVFTDNDAGRALEKKSRDLEEEYVHFLDKQKKAELFKKQAHERRADHDSVNDQASVNAQAEKQIYDREKSFKRSYDPYRRPSAYDNQEFNPHRRNEERYDYNYRYDHRVKRASGEGNSREHDDDTDFMLYKKGASSFEYKYEDRVLGKSILAGEVQDLSVTFYGTAQII